MNSKLLMNGVLRGPVDSFCLVCEYHLRGKDSTVAYHVTKAVHHKNLTACPYLDKFPGECVRKVKKGYFCEYCNLLLPTATKVSIHITENSHNDNKGSHLIRRVGNHIAISKNMLITEHAWNGIIENTCAICNAEFLNLKLHITDQKHVLSLIQKRVEFAAGDVVFRKIDASSFHCLICNVICALSVLGIHYNEDVHKSNVEICRKNYDDHIENNGDMKTSKEEDGKSKIEEIQNGKTNDSTIPNNNVKEESKKVTEKMSNNIEPKPVLKTDNKQNIQKPKNTKTTQDTQEQMSNNDVKQNKGNKKDKDVDTANNKEQNHNTKKATGKNETLTSFGHCDCFQSQTNENEKAHSVKVPKVQGAGVINTNTAQTQKFAKDDLFEFVSDFQKNGVNINFETDTAFCKICFEDVELELEFIQNHIKEHKNKPTKERLNVVHTVDLTNSKTNLNSRDIESNQADRSTIQKKYNLDQNHNETKGEEKEEIIKIDLTKKTDDNFEEVDSNLAVAPFVPGVATAKAEVPKETAKPKPDEKLNMNDPKVFAEAHKMTFNKTNKNAFCRICRIRVPASIKNMKEHVTGTSHKRKAAMAAEAENFIPKKPMAKFIHQRSTVMNVFGVDDVILNDTFCLTRMSYYMITVQNRLRCQACEVNLSEDAVLRHVDSVFHERAMENTPVLLNLNTEFVREVRPDIYHCGYCNLIVGIYEDVAKHLKCSDHLSKKREAQSRLGEHLPPILSHREQREDIFLRAMFQHFSGFM